MTSETGGERQGCGKRIVGWQKNLGGCLEIWKSNYVYARCSEGFARHRQIDSNAKDQSAKGRLMDGKMLVQARHNHICCPGVAATVPDGRFRICRSAFRTCGRPKAWARYARVRSILCEYRPHRQYIRSGRHCTVACSM